MRRILAIVCIFILLLFTGIPMFTSNLLCNQYNVYADTPDITDNEKIRQAITVYLNSKGAYLSSQGVQMDTVMFVMQQYVELYCSTRDFAEEFYDQYDWLIDPVGELAKNILVNYNPYQLALRPLSVRFFNAFLQWLIDTGKITTGQNNDALYDGLKNGDSLFYVVNGGFVNLSGNSYKGNEYTSDNVIVGTAYAGQTSEFFLQQAIRLNNFQSNNLNTTSGSFPYRFQFAGYSYDSYINIASNPGGRMEPYSPRILESTFYQSTDPYKPYGTLYCNRDKKVRGCFALVKVNPSNNPSYYSGCVVSYDFSSGKYFIHELYRYSSLPSETSNANIDFNKDNFDSSPTSLPESDGLTYQPKQDGTGNTYNTYNDYYQDWHDGDTYIYYPSDGGGGSGGNDPGGGGEDPTPGGTSPPWDGSGSDGLYSQGGTLTPDGNGGYNLNFPDVGLPDLDIDWSINGLKEKFPFSIPWDLMAFFAVMNAEPETPEIQATIPLGLWEWDIDWDLHAFDNVARILRNMELIGFCIGLILITRSIIKG